LVLASSCGDDGEFNKGQFGGPYPVVNDKVKAEKIADFTVYNLKELFVSEAALLNTDLFERSISWYKNNTSPVFPNGDKYQRYNYVVTTDGDILVAVWSAISEDGRLDLSRVAKDDANCSDVAQKLGTVSDSESIMINFYPEEPGPAHKPDKPFSPCWIGLPTGGQVGLLDALSKHFMLAQGNETSIEMFPANRQEWKEKTVAYAGEIIVDVKECLYTINNGSGTYLQNKTSDLRGVARYFEKDDFPPPAFIETLDKDGKPGLAVYPADSTGVKRLDPNWCKTQT
jgi:hypothetical protein